MPVDSMSRPPTSTDMALSPPRAASVTGLLSLPNEVLETIIVLSVLAGNPQIVASIASSCRQLHDLIYRTVDKHLWREVFLTVFDDPRSLENVFMETIHFSPISGDNYDWEEHFKSRVRTANFVKRHSRSSDAITDPFNVELGECIRSLLATITTAVPLYPGPDLTDVIPPSFPPTALLLSTSPPFSALYSSLNAIWFDNLLKDGYPALLTRKLLVHDLAVEEVSPTSFASRKKARIARRELPSNLKDSPFRNIFDKGWDSGTEGQGFYKLVFMKSFIPSVALTFPSISSPKARLRSSDNDPYLTGISQKDQYARARQVARARVYNLRYPSKERCWGPFLPLKQDTASGVEEPGTSESPTQVSIPVTDTGEVSALYVQSFLRDFIIAHARNIESDEDSDYQPSSEGDDSEVASEVDMLDSTFLHFAPLLENIDDEEEHPTFEWPDYPHGLVPDYTFLASARIVVEENLKAKIAEVDDEPEFGADFSSLQNLAEPLRKCMDALHSLEVLRMCGSPGLWGARQWRMGGYDTMNDSLSNISPTADNVDSEVDGWDWAGAEGEWRRCVCWMDYRDLLYHNLRVSPFAKIRETMRIFPMWLRVVGYEKPPPRPEVQPKESLKGKEKASERSAHYRAFENPYDGLAYTLPIIKIEGEARGSDLNDLVTRKLRGTIRMIGDGAIRWSIVSSEPDGSSPEWVTEAIQVGGIGSAMGTIGLWTGVGHTRSDPIGPSWAWKVGTTQYKQKTA